MIEEEKKLIVTDDKGNEIEMEIIFTFSKDNVNYVVYHNPLEDSEDDVNVYASIYDEEGHLFPIETDEEWDMIEEMIEAFEHDDDEEDEM